MSRNVLSGQGFAIFWGSLSIFFAVAGAYYFWQNLQHESTARLLADQEAQLRAEISDLKGKVTRLQQETEAADKKDEKAQRDTQLRQQQEALIKAAEVAEKRAREARDQAEKELEKTRSALEKTQSQMEELEKASEAPDPAAEEIRQSLQPLSQMPGVSIIDRKGMPVIRILNDNLLETRVIPEKNPRFVFSLQANVRAALDRFASLMRPYLDRREIRVESYSDGDPIPPRYVETVPSNYELSAMRASVVARFLTDQAKLPVEKVVVVGRAEAYPVSPNDTDENKAKNRRLELVVVKSPLAAEGREATKQPESSSETTEVEPPQPPANDP